MTNFFSFLSLSICINVAHYFLTHILKLKCSNYFSDRHYKGPSALVNLKDQTFKINST